MGDSNYELFVIFAQFLRTTLDALACQNPTDEQRLDALAGQNPTCRLYSGQIWTPWPVTIPHMSTAETALGRFGRSESHR